VGKKYRFQSLSEDAFTLTAKHLKMLMESKKDFGHHRKADVGSVAELAGEVALPVSSFLLQTLRNIFLRGALYFKRQ